MEKPSILNALRLLIILFILSAAACSPSPPKDLLNADDFDAIISTTNTGTVGAYTYEFWNQNGTGDAAMGLRDNSTFEIGWDGIYNMLARIGIRPGNSDTSVTYAVDDYEVTGGVSYLCVYGWAYNGSYEDLVEFYIVDNWKNFRPPGGGGTSFRTIQVDGVNYDIYTSERVSQPSINGTATFMQYWSVRQEGGQRLSGTIDVQAHFDAWSAEGLTIGSILHEVSFCIEGYGSGNSGVGHANVYELSFVPN